MITHPRHQPRSTVKLVWAKLPDRTSIHFALPRGTALWPLHTLMGRPVTQCPQVRPASSTVAAQVSGQAHRGPCRN